MTTLGADLETRREEFEAHFALAEALEDRMMLDASLGNVNLSARHINTIKSGLIVHRALQYLGEALGSVDPRRWTADSLREWLRESVVSRIAESSETGRLSTIHQTSTLLLTTPILGPQSLKKPSGTWDDKAIATFIRRMSVAFAMPPEMWARIAATPTYGDKTPMQFLADRRNAIAHGRRSFEEGASDLGLNEIRSLANVTLDYMGYVTIAFEAHIANEAHLVPAI